MARNLVTGGLGFFGLYIARQLLADGEQVVLFQRRSTPPPSAEDVKDRVKIVSGDISNWVHVVEQVKSNDIDCIYHAAALLGKDCAESPATGFRVNVIGTLNVLEAARILGVRDVIFVSSGATYSWTPPRKVFDNTMQRPTNMYATTKVCCERLGEQYHRQYGVNFRGVRFAMVNGPGRQISYLLGDCSGVIERPAQGKPYTVHVDPSSPWAIIYIKDAVQALIDLKRANENDLRQRVYNAHGFLATIGEMADTVRKYLPEAQIEFDWDKDQEKKLPNSAINYEMDNTAAREDFGWQPHYLLDETVLDFIKEVKAGRV